MSPLPHRTIPAHADSGHAPGRALVLAMLGAASILLPACAYQRDGSAVAFAERGQFGQARARVAASATDNPDDRNFILDQMKLVSMGLADGTPDAVEPTADRLYDRLRTQGLNDQSGFASVLLTEGAVRIYKGDPFEQALAFYNIALLDGLKGDWGNMRAASQQSLFLLRDFSKALQESGKTASEQTASATSSRSRSYRRQRHQTSSAPNTPASTRAPASNTPADDQVSLVRAAAVADEQGKTGDALGMDYTAIASDFEIGYVLRAIASRRLGETDDMAEALKTLAQIAPRLAPVGDLIAAGQYNTVFVVDYGMAPEKYGTGPDNAIAARAPITPSDDLPLIITAGSGSSQWPVITDINRIATSTKWANLEDVRAAKSSIGSILLAGGIVTAATAGNDDDTQVLVGLVAAGIGTLLKATSAADVRHNELFPQRTYIALAHLDQPTNRVELSVAGSSASRLILTDVPGVSADGLALRYVRLPTRSENWATSESLRYTNDRSGASASGGDCLPYILGGTDVQTPSLQALRDYQQSGYLRNFSVDDLKQLYRDEEITLAGAEASPDRTGLHILEGGSWLYTPDPASIGYKRLYYNQHPPYRPLTSRVRDLTNEIRRQRAATDQQSRSSLPPRARDASRPEQNTPPNVVSPATHEENA